ncbi:MAG: hypothetical protein J6O04_02220 [Selenomonadaceae bacterium]|nr:hypothetical protein [Selenomonadaceae bacterium]
MKKKIFPVIIIVCCIFLIGGLLIKPDTKPVITDEMRYAMEEERKLAAAWYEVHQKNIDRLDRNFRLYHDILENYREGVVTREECVEQLTSLENDARDTLLSVRNNLPSTNLQDTSYDLIVAIREKTIRYAEAMYHSIGKVRLAAENNGSFEVLDDIRARENPIGLFVAKEVVALRNALEVKE